MVAGIALSISSLLVSDVWAYGHHDVTQIVRTTNGPNGRRPVLDMGVVNAVIDDLWRSAASYPPQFSNQAERRRATQDAARLSDMLDIFKSSASHEPELLLSMGRVNAVAHNLDIPHAAKRAEAAYQELLAQQPRHPWGNYGYGLFLAGTARAKAALPYLNEAVAQGVDAASFTLGMSYLVLQDKRRALSILSEYAKVHPGDEAARRLVQSIQ